MTFHEKFDEIKKLTGKRVKLEREFAIQINMTDSDCGGAFYAAFKDGVFSVEPYDYHDHDAMITTESYVIEGLLKGEITPEDAFSTGKAYVEGDMDAVRELLKKCKKKTARKPAAKKTEAEEKAPAKKAPARKKKAE